MRIAIVYSLPSHRMKQTKYAGADEDTAVIAEKVSQGLAARGYSPSLYAVSEDNLGEIALIKADCVFNLIEWCGLDTTLAKEAFRHLRQLEIPVTGSSEELYVLTGDKIRMKQALKDSGVTTPWGVGVATTETIIEGSIPYPVIVKPHVEHCSIGLSNESVAHNANELQQIITKQINEFEQPVLVEEFIPGRELLVYLTEIAGEIKILPVVEMLFEGGNPMAFQTYDAKWEEKSQDYNATYYDQAVLIKEEYTLLESNCLAAFKKLGFWGYARFDVRLRDGVPYILETNANPSVYDATEEIDNIESEVIEGIKFPDYLDGIVKSAVWHYERGERV